MPFVSDFGVVEWLVFAAFVGIVFVRPVVSLVRSGFQHAANQREAERAEAFFKSAFPDLQPIFHPANVVKYVEERVRRAVALEGRDWDDPPGFAMAKRASFEQTPKGERTVLLDTDGRRLGEFLFARDPRPGTLGIVRVGAGKFRVKKRSGRTAWTSYWHPAREFEWRGPGTWSFKSAVADQSLDSGPGSSFSSDASSTSSAARAAATGAGIVAAGGTFDGGGAAAAWDDASGSGSAASGGGSSDSSAVESGSSTSTAY